MNLQELLKNVVDGTSPYKNFDEYLEHFVPNVLAKSETLQEAVGVKENEMEEIYALAYEKYCSNNFAEALPLFRLLVMLDPYSFRSWMGLGATLQLLTDYESALKSYAIASLCNRDDPYPHFHAYECYAAQSNDDDGSIALDHALSRSLGKPEYLPLVTKIHHIKVGMSHACH